MANNNNHVSTSPSRKWIIIVAILVLVVVLSAFLSLRPRRIRVTVAQPQRQDISSTITTNGKVEPVTNFEAHAPAGQYLVKRVLVAEGDQVNRGQLLLQLDDANIRQQAAGAMARIRAAEANLSIIKAGGSQEELIGRKVDVVKAQAEQQAAKRNLDSFQRLHDRGAASDAELQAAKDRLAQANASLNALNQKSTARYSSADRARFEADLADARAAYDAAEEALKNANVLAPFAGTVYSIPVRAGAFVNGGDIMLQVADLAHMQVRAFVDEPEIGKLQKGQFAKITWDATPGRVWTGTLVSLPTNIVSRGSRMVGEILCRVNNEDRKLLPNVNVGVTVIIAEHPNTLTIPREAIREEDSRKYIFVVKGSHLEKREIKTGVSNLTKMEVVDGLQPNETIAVASLSPSPMTDGVSIKIEEQ